MDSNNYADFELYLISWIESLRDESIFCPEEIFAFQLLAINLIYTIRMTKERKVKDKQNQENQEVSTKENAIGV